MVSLTQSYRFWQFILGLCISQDSHSKRIIGIWLAWEMLLFTYGYGHACHEYRIHLLDYSFQTWTPDTKSCVKSRKVPIHGTESHASKSHFSITALKAFKVLTQTLSLKSWKLLKSSAIFKNTESKWIPLHWRAPNEIFSLISTLGVDCETRIHLICRYL